MGEAGVKFVLYIADNDEKIGDYMEKDGFASENFKALYDGGMDTDTIILLKGMLM